MYHIKPNNVIEKILPEWIGLGTIIMQIDIN